MQIFHLFVRYVIDDEEMMCSLVNDTKLNTKGHLQLV